MASPPLDALKARLAGLEQELKGLVAAREESDRKVRVILKQLEADLQTQVSGSKKEGEAERDRLQEDVEARKKAVEERHARDLARIESAHGALVERARKAGVAEIDRIDEREKQEKDKAAKELRHRHVRVEKDVNSALDDLVALRAEADRLKKRLEAHAGRMGARLEGGPPPLQTPQVDPGEIMDAVRSEVAAGHKALNDRLKEAGYRFAFTSNYIAWLTLAFFAHAGLALWIFFARREWLTVGGTAVGVLFVAIVVGVLVLRGRLRRKASIVIRALHANLENGVSLLNRREALLRREGSPDSFRLLEENVKLMSSIAKGFEKPRQEAERRSAARIERFKVRREALWARADRRKEQALGRIDAEVRDGIQSLDARSTGEVTQRRRHHEERVRKARSEGEAESAALETKWKDLVDGIRRESEEACREREGKRVPWSDPSWREFRLPETFPDRVELGTLAFPLSTILSGASPNGIFPVPDGATLRYPVQLSFPDRGCLLLGAEPGARDAALSSLFGTVLRILTSFPAGKAKFLVFDPVGLGQSFSALMHLADYDESLVGGRIWTEMPHIERKLSELTEHVEKVIQKYLRNRYKTIDEYNRSAGQMAEAYWFLVVADFPTGFSDLAMERLSSLVTSGARCGVFPIVLQDLRQEPPRHIDLDRFRSNGLVLHADARGISLTEDVLKQGILEMEPPPEAEALTSLLHVIGKQCVDAGRVEVPFRLVAPEQGKEWSLSTEKGVRIPLGRAGADRLQFMELGRGTAQHVLVAGKTGSGKSTLFHVMIASAAEWYRPDELELYLIDYKKGVEFKRFADHALPHARVVAIESDREFGLSVLRRIDEELIARAEAFRKKGVQDFGAYRRATPDAPLPRALLLIDEFQEFFTEEDSIAQEAALLLDRIVRQGRAFGVHVILGSQTLGGSYTLAKTTLGQMAIRIALQCNEADSYLILSDDNAAARLLSRPGEAIYNDMSGMVEGNNPFQVVWLPDEEEEGVLKRVRERAEAAAWKPRGEVTIFEGNVPADLRRNPILAERLAKPYAVADPVPRLWLGEANAIKGPTEIVLRRQGGSNVLMVGQQRESAMSIVFSSVVSLASGLKPDRARFVILDGTPPDARQGRVLTELNATVPHPIEWVEYAAIPEVMEKLDAEVRGRLDGDRPAESLVFLVVFDLQRFRKLRQSDEFDFGGSEESKPSPDKCFVNILTEGPLQGVHSMVWCDSLANINRQFNRKTLREFESRVLFQMSAGDSSELIDSPAASKLGLYRGLLNLEEQGTTEKFRPYAMPDAPWTTDLKARLTC